MDDIRTIDELIDLPYSEMSEAEIDLIVEFKATCKARDAEYQERMQILKDTMNAEIEIHKQAANVASANLDELTRLALESYAKA